MNFGDIHSKAMLALELALDESDSIGEGIDEGVYDANIFKAVFMAGGLGSGKSYIMKRVLAIKKGIGGLGFKVYESDAHLERMLKDANMPLTNDAIQSPAGKEMRKNALDISDRFAKNWLMGRLPIVYDGSGRNLDKMMKQVNAVEALGYEVAMVFVKTTKATSVERDAKRSRTLGTEVVERNYDSIYGNLSAYQNYFGNNFILVDNEEFGREDLIGKAIKEVDTFVRRPVNNPIAKKWIADELALKQRD